MSFSVAREHRQIVAAIRKLGKKGGSPATQHYVGSPHPVLGLSVPQMRGILAAFRKAHRDITAKEVNALAARLHRGTTYEEKATAFALMDAHARILDETSWRLLDSWVDESVGWGLCDALGGWPIAKLVRKKPERFREILRWAKSPNPWRRRIAAYALHDFVLAKELDKPFVLLEKLLYDEEFWVQRAVGTWLRECWKRDPRRTEAFLRKHAKRLPSVVITVATERAPREFREELRRRKSGPRLLRRVQD